MVRFFDASLRRINEIGQEKQGGKAVKTIDRLKSEFSSGRISRRRFMEGASALGLGVIGANAFASQVLAATPKRGGRLRIGMSGGNTKDTLFGVFGLGGPHQVCVQWQLLNNLTEVNGNGELVGELAESWEASPDATQWVFKLRRGVEFHNGKMLEAQDVIESINAHRGEDTKSTGKGLVASVTDIKADGKDTVVFTLAAGNADFPFTLSDYHFPIAPAGTTEADWVKGVGTGPFTLVEWEPGVRAITKRNPNYFKDGPYFDAVETLHLADTTARISTIQTGAADVIDKPDTKTLHLLEQMSGMRIIELAGNTHYTFPMLMDQAPYDNADVRNAMKYAIDRQAIVNTILNGHGYPGNDHPISRAMRYYASDLPQREYDPDKARYHLKKAGLSSLDVELFAADIYTGGTDAAVLFKEHAAKAGININVRGVPTDGYWTGVWNVKPLCVSYWAGRPSEDLMLTLAFSNQSAWNETHWDNERFEKVLLEARAEQDEAKRREMYGELQRLIRDEGGLIAPVFANTITVTTDKVGTPDQISPAFAMDGLKGPERWWFA